MSDPAPAGAAGLFVLGATHHSAPIAVRERLSPTPAAAAALQADLKALEGLREFTMVSTCNRIEFYGVGVQPDTAVRVQEIFCRHQRFEPAEFDRFRLRLHGEQAVRHLLDVASGLDSQMLGETEIFGQVKDAYAAAQSAGHTGAVLNRFFQKAFQAAKYVRTHTAITEGQISVANVAVDLARDIFGELSGARVLLLGAGEIGEKTARAFQSRGATAISVASRRLERAMELANDLRAFALPFWLAPVKLPGFDIVVCATAAPDTVIQVAAVTHAMRQRPARPLLFLDLALPRDVDPQVADLQNVFLYNLDDLAKIAEQNLHAREAELAKCRALLDERTGSLWSSLAPRLP